MPIRREDEANSEVKSATERNRVSVSVPKKDSVEWMNTCFPFPSLPTAASIKEDRESEMRKDSIQ